MDKPARASKERNAAEDKVASMTVSARNNLASLVGSARDYFRIGQERVANKYLGRLEKVLPGTARVAQKLRDLLSSRDGTGRDR